MFHGMNPSFCEHIMQRMATNKKIMNPRPADKCIFGIWTMELLITAMFLSCGAIAVKAQTTNTADSLTIESMIYDLPEVMVEGSHPVVKVERGTLSYNMPQLLKQLPADNAYEALTRIPGISDADGNIKFFGNAVTLIVNGQPTTQTQEQLVDRLKAIPATQLAKAEVMLSAPARLHVRGMAINIVTKDYSGTNQLSGQLVGAWQQSKYGIGIGKGYFSVQRGKFGMDAQYSYYCGNSYGESSRIANHPLGDKSVAYNDETWQKSFGVVHDYRLGMNYAFAKNHRIDVAYTGKWSKSLADNHTTGSSIAGQHSDTHANLHNVDVNYSLPFGLQLSGSYTYYRTPQQQILEGTLSVGEDSVEVERDLTTNSRQTINKWMFAADQNHSLKHGWGLSYGVKAQFTSNNSFQTILDGQGNVLSDASGKVDIFERIWNIYAGFSKQITKDISLEASIAAERYHFPDGTNSVYTLH